MVGRVVKVWPGVGWLVAAAPILLLGGLVTAGLVLVVRRTARVPLAVLGASISVAAVLVIQQPLSNAEWLGVEQGDGTATSTYVSTGLLPIDITAQGSTVRLSSGEAGAVKVETPESGRVEVDVRAPRAGLVLGAADAALLLAGHRLGAGRRSRRRGRCAPPARRAGGGRGRLRRRPPQ